MRGKSFKKYSDIINDKDYFKLLNIIKNAEDHGLSYLRPVHLLYILTPNMKTYKATSIDRKIGIYKKFLDEIKKDATLSKPLTDRMLSNMLKILYEMRLIEILKWTKVKPQYRIINVNIGISKGKTIYDFREKMSSLDNLGFPNNPNLWFTDIRHRNNWITLSDNTRYYLSGTKKEDSDKIFKEMTQQINDDIKHLMIGDHGELKIPTVLEGKNTKIMIFIENEKQREKIWKNVKKITHSIDKICSLMGKDDCIFVIEKIKLPNRLSKE